MFGNGKTAETRAGVTFRCGRVSVWLHVETNAFHETLEFVAVNGAKEFPLEFRGMGIWLGPEREQHSDVAAFLHDCMSKPTRFTKPWKSLH